MLLRFFFWSELPQRPTWRQLPRCLLAVAAGGVVCGPALALVIGWLIGVPIRRQLGAHLGAWLAAAAGVGALFATSFYVTCRLPQEYLTGRVTRYPPRLAQAVRFAVGAVGGMLGFSLAMFVLQTVAGAAIFQPGLSWRTVMVSTVIAIVATAFFIQRGELERERLLRERTVAEAAARAQVAALQAQINPHFFFNTLNTLSALIGTDTAAAKDVVQSLAGMFRYSLACTQDGLARLEDELRFVEDYLALERRRLGERLEVRWRRSGNLEGVRIPGLALQPLVENAIRHGIARRLKPGSLEIALAREGAVCRVTVLNQVEPSEGIPDLSPERLWRAGHALRIVRDRLAAHYGGAAALAVGMEGGMVAARMHFPAAAHTEGAEFGRGGTDERHSSADRR
jgi:hypothetical protein